MALRLWFCRYAFWLLGFVGYGEGFNTEEKVYLVLLVHNREDCIKVFRIALPDNWPRIYNSVVIHNENSFTFAGALADSKGGHIFRHTRLSPVSVNTRFT